MTTPNVQFYFHTLRSSSERLTVLTGAWGTDSSLSRGEGRGSTGSPPQISFNDAILVLRLRAAQCLLKICANSQLPTSYQGLPGVWRGCVRGLVGGVRQVLQSDWLSFRTLFSDLYSNIKGVHAEDCVWIIAISYVAGEIHVRHERLQRDWLNEWTGQASSMGHAYAKHNFPFITR